MISRRGILASIGAFFLPLAQLAGNERKENVVFDYNKYESDKFGPLFRRTLKLTVPEEPPLEYPNPNLPYLFCVNKYQYAEKAVEKAGKLHVDYYIIKSVTPDGVKIELNKRETKIYDEWVVCCWSPKGECTHILTKADYQG